MKLKSLFLLTFILSLGACRGIPNSYLGTFQNAEGTVTLDLDTFSAELKFKDGRKLEAKLEEMNADKLKEVKPAIYGRQHPYNSKLVEIFWVIPRPETAKVVEGLLFYNAEIFMSLAEDKTFSSADSLVLAHCSVGAVMIDLATSRVQVGCAEGAEKFALKKIADRNPDSGWPGDGTQ